MYSTFNFVCVIKYIWIIILSFYFSSSFVILTFHTSFSYLLRSPLTVFVRLPLFTLSFTHYILYSLWSIDYSNFKYIIARNVCYSEKSLIFEECSMLKMVIFHKFFYLKNYYSTKLFV